MGELSAEQPKEEMGQWPVVFILSSNCPIHSPPPVKESTARWTGEDGERLCPSPRFCTHSKGGVSQPWPPNKSYVEARFKDLSQAGLPRALQMAGKCFLISSWSLRPLSSSHPCFSPLWSKL